MAEEKEEIVMTPSKKGKTTQIRIEKRRKLDLGLDDSVEHVGGGRHSGLVVNKQADTDDLDLTRPQLQIGFNCFLVDQKTEHRMVESRRLKFWYVDGTEYLDQVTTAYEFFKELVKPENFPRDYVGFIKKCMKQMQKPEYKLAKMVDLEIKLLDEEDAPLSPGRNAEDIFGLNREDKRPTEDIVREKMLHILESAYPNVLEVEDLIRMTQADEAIVRLQLSELKQRDLVREVENGKIVRHVLEDDKTEVQMVKQMPTIAANQQPTIAIITANYGEKLAVDAMMESKTTFVKFKSEGESNVYTMGYIGEHRVVSTKLPAIGHARAAQISSGNTTTRLLGTFQNIEHVFVVGIAGGVPHYTDYYKHVRLGDIVVSACDSGDSLYYYCEKVLRNKEGDIQFKFKTFTPKEKDLQNVLEKLKDRSRRKPEKAPWEKYITEGLETLKNQEADFNRPPPESDRLYMGIGDDNVIEVQHPESPDSVMNLHQGSPNIHFSPIGSGRFYKSEQLRMDFAQRHGVMCFDTEFDQVLESIVGNRKDSFLFIRGIADYGDGTRNKEWGPYASLVAASMMKAIIKMISNPCLSEDED
ncbi:uncharacterized protein LOC110467415 isoform X2 [Mizuhopecten yessoensis]|uniref:uncharacterized protein LOC110467415 isoform X2 n=1 Tax=Mizuhopecten yessoensis TaxID=6573 RepID=UPI000B45C2EC|nr:uncharacterized protein LOC110467415 isoform X2 [Mizuhopecten yessoensis]